MTDDFFFGRGVELENLNLDPKHGLKSRAVFKVLRGAKIAYATNYYIMSRRLNLIYYIINTDNKIKISYLNIHIFSHLFRKKSKIW